MTKLTIKKKLKDCKDKSTKSVLRLILGILSFHEISVKTNHNRESLNTSIIHKCSRVEKSIITYNEQQPDCRIQGVHHVTRRGRLDPMLQYS